MAAVYAAIIMQLVDHDIAEILEVFRPPRMMRQNAAVQHVWIGKHDLGALPDGLAGILRSIAVVGEYLDVRANLLDGGMKFVKLVLGERFCRKQVHGARARV